MPQVSEYCSFIHTWLEVCVLTVPSRLLRAMSAYAERKAAGRRRGDLGYIYPPHTRSMFPQVADVHTVAWTDRGWLQWAHTLKALIRTNLPNVSRLAPCQTGQCSCPWCSSCDQMCCVQACANNTQPSLNRSIKSSFELTTWQSH